MIQAKPIETAPRDGTEIYLISVQHGGAIISIYNGFWEKDGFTIGSPGFNSGVGDACATHWMSKSAIKIDYNTNIRCSDCGNLLPTKCNDSTCIHWSGHNYIGKNP